MRQLFGAGQRARADERGDGQVITLARVERDLLIVACAISAGVHAALTPDHFAEGAGPGAGFATAAVLLAAVVVGLARRPASAAVVAGASAVLAGLLASYAFATTTGLPLLHPHPEPLDGLALGTKAIEAAALLAAAHLLWRSRPFLSVLHLQPKGS